MSSLDVNAKILTSTSSDNLEMQIFENGESKSVSFNISETNDPRNAALVLCEQQKIDPNAHVSTTLVEALAEIAMARCKEGMIVVQKESSKQSDERTVLLEKKLREATDIVKRLSNALRDMRKAKAVNDRIVHHYKKEKRKENVSLLSSPMPSPSYVKNLP